MTLPLYLPFFNLYFFSADINRPSLYLHISLGEILPDNSHTEKLHPADQTQNTDHGRPARSRIPENQRFSDDNHDHQKGKRTEQNAEDRGKGERRRGKCHDSFQRIGEKFPEGPLCLPFFPLHIIVPTVLKLLTCMPN